MNYNLKMNEKSLYLPRSGNGAKSCAQLGVCFKLQGLCFWVQGFRV